eukprot:1171340-Pyramimonas_sp.AAC.1
MGELFLDGSCTRCIVPELNRAAWGLAIFDRAFRFLGRVFGTAYACLPQTSQAGEFVAFGCSSQ